MADEEGEMELRIYGITNSWNYGITEIMQENKAI